MLRLLDVRDRFGDYVAALRVMAEDLGIRGVLDRDVAGLPESIGDALRAGIWVRGPAVRTRSENVPARHFWK